MTGAASGGNGSRRGTVSGTDWLIDCPAGPEGDLRPLQNPEALGPRFHNKNILAAKEHRNWESESLGSSPVSN
ncbi:hypothetical protein AB1E18_008679 [Capra hircus]